MHRQTLILTKCACGCIVFFDAGKYRKGSIRAAQHQVITFCSINLILAKTTLITGGETECQHLIS